MKLIRRVRNAGYLSGGSAHERHGVSHFLRHRHGRQLSLMGQSGLSFQGELGLAGQRGGQELGSTLVPENVLTEQKRTFISSLRMFHLLPQPRVTADTHPSTHLIIDEAQLVRLGGIR